jgi:hemerythrin-like domain-containing protein
VDERRSFLLTMGSTLGLTLAACASSAGGGVNAPDTARDEHEGGEHEEAEHDEAEHDEAEVTPGEDLMQEHGVLERVLLVYDESARRIVAGEAVDLTIITTAADIVRRFIEEYHEKHEEQFVFPRLQQAGREVELVAVLTQQHRRGREVTAEIARRASGPASPELVSGLRSFVRMYRPHASREETVLFPAFREVVGRAGYHELGEQFEAKEHELFGEHGFDEFVQKVAAMEKQLGIYDLESFTP